MGRSLNKLARLLGKSMMIAANEKVKRDTEKNK